MEEEEAEVGPDLLEELRPWPIPSIMKTTVILIFDRWLLEDLQCGVTT